MFIYGYLTTKDFKGMDASSLQQYEVLLNQGIADVKRDIKAKEAELKEMQDGLRALSNAKVRLTRERSKGREIAYEYVIKVEKRQRSQYIGNKSFSKYSGYVSSDFKEFVAYSFAVYKVNVLGADKGKESITSSEEYMKDTKAKMTDDIIAVMTQYNITKIFLERGVTIGTAKIKQKYPNVQIISN